MAWPAKVKSLAPDATQVSNHRSFGPTKRQAARTASLADQSQWLRPATVFRAAESSVRRADFSR